MSFSFSNPIITQNVSGYTSFAKGYEKLLTNLLEHVIDSITKDVYKRTLKSKYGFHSISIRCAMICFYKQNKLERYV